MNTDEQLTRLKQRLDAIGRLRLLTETDEELSRLVEHRVDEKNGLGRLGGRSLFLKQATYDALCRYANERANHDFDQFLTDYEKASAFYEKYQMEGLMRKDREAMCSQLLDAMYGSTAPQASPPTPSPRGEGNFNGRGVSLRQGEEDNPLSYIYNKVYGTDRNEFAIHPMVLVLIGLGLLPADFSRSRGRVGNLLEDFRSLFRFLHQHVSRNGMFERLPLLEQCEERVLSGTETYARFWLYDDMADVLENYYNIVNMNMRMMANRELRERQLWPLLDGTIWQGQTDCVWWQWEKINNGFFLHHLTLIPEEKRIVHEKFEVILYDDNGHVMAYVIHPQSILSVVEGRPISPNHHETLEVQWDNDENPTTITFCTLSSFHWFQVTTLQRCNMTAHEFMQKYDDYRQEEKYPDAIYKYNIGIAAITPEAVFIPAEDDTFYRIPITANKTLCQLNIDDPAGLITFPQSSRRFVTFTDLNLFYEVTTEELCKQHGIEKVKDFCQ